MPEVIHDLPRLQGIDYLTRKALRDTQNPELADASGMSALVEYFNISSEFSHVSTCVLADLKHRQRPGFPQKEKEKSLP